MKGDGAPPTAPAGLLFALVTVTFGMHLVARGVAETFSLFLLPVQESLGSSRSAMTGVYSLYMLALGVGGLLAGRVFDRFGPRTLYAMGLLGMGGGYWLAGQVTGIWQYYLTVGLLGGLGGAALGMVPAAALLSRWFTRRLGLVIGLAYASMGVGVLVLLPLTQLMLEHVGWRTAYSILGGSILVLAVPVLLAPLSTLAGRSRKKNAPRPTGGTPGAGWTLAGAMREPAFWGLFMVYFFTSYAAYSILPQAVAYLVEMEFDPLFAASAVGFTGFLSVFGMAGVGWLSDRIGQLPTVTLSYLSTLTGIAALILLAYVPGAVLVYVFVLFFGLCQGARGPVIATMAARLFAGGRMGSIYGAISLGLGLGAAVGSWASGLFYDITGGYMLSFTLAGVASVIGLAQFYVVPTLRYSDRPRPETVRADRRR